MKILSNWLHTNKQFTLEHVKICKLFYLLNFIIYLTNFISNMKLDSKI